MDSATCNVIYVDRSVRAGTQITPTSTTEDIVAALGDAAELESSLSMLRDAFGEVHVCATGVACIEKLIYLHDASMVELKPTLVLIDIPYDEQLVESPPPSRDPSPHSRKSADALQSGQGDQDLYGLRLLEKIVYELHSRNLTKLVVPIPVVSSPLMPSAPLESEDAETRNAVYEGYPNQPPQKSLPNRALLRKCLDTGAADVMASPLHVKTLATLEVHAYRAHKEAMKEQQALLELRRGRKRSWVGVHEEKPFAYLREAMVSGLMSGICRSGEESDDAMIGSMRVNVSSDQKAMIADAVGKWNFCAHDFGDDQLLIVASLIFKHAFTMPELEPWRIPTEQLTTFLVACRAAYNGFVPYHNFRHAVDVLQATFNFLVQVGSLPPYPLQSGVDATPKPKSPLATLLQPFEALTLLISAIGHDVGHPGVNNGFLVTLNAPLAQLYNDRSVLESFHCAAFSQILRRYWPAAFENTKMRSLMISSILATDMGLHFDYMTKLESLQEKLHKKNSTEEWNGRTVEKETALACALLIKCADISNVARGYDTALKWMHILCDEFSRQASMESQIGISSSLVSEPKKDFLSLAKAQIGFMNLFAIPLFQGVSDVLPAMKYAIQGLEGNQNMFEEAIEEIREMDEECKRAIQDGARSPRTVTMAVSMGDSIDSSSGKTLEAPTQNLPEHPAEIKQAASSPPDQAQRIPNMPGEYDEINGISGDYDAVAEFAASDPFHMHDGENRMIGHRGKQRSSETTEGSNSAPYSGDWASQATSATTGKMPLSPSTQGTSIISQESLEQPSTTIPPSSVEVPEPNHLPLPLPPMERASSNEEHSNGSTLKMDMSPGPEARSPSADKSLKKKPSRFRMNALKLFRRDKSSSPSPSGETGG